MGDYIKYGFAKGRSQNKHELASSRHYQSNRIKAPCQQKHCLICFAEIEEGRFCDSCADFVKRKLRKTK